MADGTRVYTIGQVTFDWGGIDLMSGFARDGELVITPTVVQKWTQKDTGVRGASTVQIADPSNSGTIELPVDAETDLYQKLMLVQSVDSRLFNQVAPGLMKDLLDGSAEAFQGMRIANQPPRRKGFGGSIAAFMFIYTTSEFIPNLNDKNLVGAGITPADPLGA